MNLELLDRIEWSSTYPEMLDGLFAASLRGGIVALLACLLVLAWHHRAAADRHAVWMLVLLSFALIPLLGFLSPAWQWTIPSWRNQVNTLSSVDLPSREVVMPDQIMRPKDPLVTASEQPWRVGWLPLWLLGVAMVWLRVVLGWLSLALLQRRSGPQPSEALALQSRADALRLRMGITKPVEVFVSARRVMPMTWGIWCPKLLLPVEALSWEENRLDAVLTHELAHVQRRDSAGQVLGQMLLGIYWFHPAMWLAIWRLAVERERACDDIVLTHGVKASDYAAHLVSVSTGRELQQACAIAMAGSAQLEARLQRVLDSALCRQGMSSLRCYALIALTVLVLAPVTFMQVTAQDSVEIEDTSPNNGDVNVEALLPEDPNALLDLPKDKQAAVDAAARSINRNLDTQYGEALAELVMLEELYGDRHPKMIVQRALVAELEAQIESTRAVVRVAIVRVATPQPGIVRKVSVKAGDTVKSGDVLVTLDQRRAKLAVDAAQSGMALAEASMEQAQRSLQMAQNKVERGAISHADLGTAELQAQDAHSRLATAQTKFESARFDLEDLVIRSPTDGKVLAVNVHVGEYTTPESPVIRLQSTPNDE